MSSICKSFESNAWRSDLCSHCFQSKEEHDLLLQPMTSSDPTKDVASSALPSSNSSSSSSTGLGSRYQSVLNHCRSSYRTGSTTAAAATIGSLTPVVTATTTAATKTTTGPTASVMNPSTRSPSGVKAILKTNGNSRTKHSKSVNFADGDEDAQVIGYGGQECFDDDADDEEIDHRNSNDDDDDVPFTEEERMIHNQTQKNTSFNSVSRNLLASEVATFKNHGVSSTRVASSSTSSAPLVTIRPFGQSAPSLNSAARTKPNGATSDCPKINLVSPMRNGQVLTAGIARSTAATNQTNNKEQMKNRENLLKKSEQLIDNVAKKPEVEKITSFSDPVPAVISTHQTAVEDQPLPTPPASPTPTAPPDVACNTKAIVLQSSRVASGRIESDSSKPASNRSTLSRKPPVWREKPRIPIKPQTAGAPPPAGVAESIVVASHPAIKVNSGGSKSPQPQMKLQNAECQPGQISIRFVHLSCGGDDTAPEAPSNFPSLIPANDSTIPQKCPVVKQLSALERLDLLGSSENLTEALPSSCVALPEPSPPPKVAEVETISPNFVLEHLTAAEVVTPPRTPSPITIANEINNNPIKAVLPEQQAPFQTHPDAQPSESSKSPRLANKSDETNHEATSSKTDSFSVDCRSNSTRGLTRSAFEALRANLAGTLELSRVCQPQRGINGGNPKRQAPPTPLSCDTENSQSDSGPSSPPSSLASLNMADPVLAPLPPPTESPPSPPPAPALPSLIECVVTMPAKQQSPPNSVEKIRPPERAISASPRFRNSLICTSPDGGSMAVDEEDGHPRSVSLTRVERSDSQSMATKPPSIRKFIKERATHFLHMADGGGSCGSSRPSGSRLSRSDRFAAESRANGKKGKSRFSLRKFLGLKKDGGWDEPAEPLPPKIRPEIVHPIDFHPIGQVQVVQGKVENSSNDSVIGRSPAHDSISSGDSGRHSSLEMQQSDSSLGSSDCPSPANSHQSNSFKSSSLKGRPKPPPPPRMHSLDQPLVVAAPQRSNASTPTNRPSRPPPPKSSDAKSHDVSRFSPSPVHNSRPNAAEYANLGDIRNGITPKKPERSASMRTRERSTTYDSHALESKQDGLHYDCVSIQQPSPVNKPTADEDGYIIPMRMKSSPSFSSVSSSSASSGQRHSSLTSFQPTQEGPAPSRRSNRLSGMRQSRQDLHVKLEDHYGTVTGANFQALAQLLEQATSKRPLAPHFHELRRVKCQDLKWNVFEDHCVLLRTASVTFMQSTWQNHDLLLSVFNDTLLQMAENKAPFAQPAVVTFTAHVPAPLLPARGIQTAGIEVFPPGQVAMLKQLPHLLTLETGGQMERLQQSLSILLQICRAMEWLSQQKRVANRLNHEEIVFYREHSQDAYRLLWLPQEAESGLGLSVKETLSSCIRLLTPLLSNQLADKLFVILQRDVVSVDRMCQFLEYTMFGPSADLIDGDHDPSELDMFQRWLDVERASTLNELIRTQGLWRVKLSVVEEFRLSFLISTSPHHLFDTSQI